MFSLKAKSDNASTAGIAISSEGIALAIIGHNKLGPIIQHAQFYPCTSSEHNSRLTELASQFHLSDISCNLVLSPSEYQLSQVDAPEVPKQELQAALYWQVKDLIDFHIDDAVIDHIELPNNSASGKKQLLIVASRQSTIQSHVDLLQSSNCNLATIDVAVQATRNIISHIPSENNSVGVLNLWDDLSKISVVLDHDIYINRSSSIGGHSLSFVTEEDINSQSILDSLALELQRTFDYYESRSRQAPVTQLFILNNGIPVNNLNTLIQQRLGIECLTINVADVITISDNINEAINNKCLMAIGGALRSTF